MTSSYDAVVFDNDGVLTYPTPRDVLREATVDAFERVGVTDPTSEHVDAIHLHVTPDDLQTAAGAYDLDPAELWRARDEAFAEVQIADMEQGRKPLYEDYDAVRSLDGPRGIVSTNQHATIEAILDHHGIRGDFHTHYGREMVPASLHRKKPESHYLDRALADLDVDPGDALFVGDSESDVLAARNAGTDSAFLWRDHRDGYELDATPDYELDSLHDLVDVA
ncbi:HAD family hydrolase [Halobacterium rubrum]|uniref:HAD family hydrolase n=1 Tax=Halobacterium TaxID=2239 RepID=UPI001F432508|nr:HAD family hydrolase [Halobacterium rubrum]MDH5019489.1 HAD family hydrolase [Halobacterium rubrum]